MNDTERYLNAATKGLWGKQRRALRDELKGHIDTRIQEFRLGGLSVPEAERQTLRELGAPVQVSTGMLGVYTLPAFGKAGVLSLLLLTGLLTVVPQGLAQVGSIYTSPHISISATLTGAKAKGEVYFGASSYLDFEQLRKELAKAGAQLNGPINRATLILPGTPRPTQPLELVAPQYGSGTLAQNGRTYIMTDTLVNGLANSGADVSVTGWINPVLHAGKTKVQIQTDDWRVASSLYMNALTSAGPELRAGAAFFMLEPNGDTSVLNFSGSLTSNKVYALITSDFGYGAWTMTGSDGKVIETGNIFLTTSFDQAQMQKAMFRIKSGAKNYKLYASVADFQAALDPSRDPDQYHHWDPQHPAPALLLELSGHFGRDAYTVVNPSTVKGTLSDH